MKLRLVRIMTALAFALVLTLLISPGYAPGQPASDIRARAAQLERDLDASNHRVATLSQQLDAAQKRVDESEANVAAAQAQVKVAQDAITRIKTAINERAASIYKVAGASGPLDALNAEDANDLTTRAKYSDVAAHHDDALLDELAAAKQHLDAQRDEADKARAEAATERDAVALSKAEADEAAATQQRLLDQVKGEMEQALRAQTADRAAAAPKDAPSGHGGGGGAAAYAQAQVGKAYCNTSERFGPNCYDCSGLTYMSWRAGGLEIPKVSGAQGSAFPRVDLGSLQPGDLVTSSSWGAHVGIWVGGGYVHATSYRNNPNAVKFVAGTGSVVDAVRPG